MSRFVMNPLFKREVEASPQLVARLAEIAARKAEKARSIAPVGNPAEDPHPGQFRDSIDHDAGVEDGRAVGRVLSTDEDFKYIEFGTEHSPPHATLRRCLDGDD